MIRFRLGQRWRTEAAHVPMDAFGLELDGVELLPEAIEEPLARSVEELLRAVQTLAKGGTFAQLSLTESHLELVFARGEDQVDLRIVSLSRPARSLRPAVRVTLEELRHAAVRCGASWTDAFEDPSDGDTGLKRAVRALARSPLKPPRWPSKGAGFGYRCEARDQGLGFLLQDPEDLLQRYRRSEGASLGPLMCGGELSTCVGGSRFSAPGIPFLFALELARQAGDILATLEGGEPRMKLKPAGLLPQVELEVGDGPRAVGLGPCVPAARAFAQGMFELGLEVVFALTLRNRALGSNPYVGELAERCRQGLAQLRTARPPHLPGMARSARPREAAQSVPLNVPGRLRRLRFEKSWSQALQGGPAARLRLVGDELAVQSGNHLSVLDASGQLRFTRAGSRGVAVLPALGGLSATETRLSGFGPGAAQPRWIRDHDGLPVDSGLLEMDGVWLGTSEARQVTAFQALTGRELWRISPPRSQQLFVAVQAHRAVLTTDSGYLFGLDLADALVRYRLRAALPFLGPAQPWGRRFLALLGRGEHSTLLAADAHSGSAAWSCELELSGPSHPVVQGRRAFVAGTRSHEGRLVCVGAQGAQLWERALHLGPGPFHVLLLGKGVVVSTGRGAAARFDAEGNVEWRVGVTGEESVDALPAIHSRGVLFLPGEDLRALDPRGGQEFARVRVGPGLIGMKVDAKLNLYALLETGLLECYRLSTHLAVVSGD